LSPTIWLRQPGPKPSWPAWDKCWAPTSEHWALSDLVSTQAPQARAEIASTKRLSTVPWCLTSLVGSGTRGATHKAFLSIRFTTLQHRRTRSLSSTTRIYCRLPFPTVGFITFETSSFSHCSISFYKAFTPLLKFFELPFLSWATSSPWLILRNKVPPRFMIMHWYHLMLSL